MLTLTRKKLCPAVKQVRSVLSPVFLNNAIENYKQNRSGSSNFNKEEENHIVNIINTCDAEEFHKYEIKGVQLKKLLSYREKNGKFQSFEDILIIQDVPSLIKLCKSILDGGKKIIIPKKTISGSKSIVTPPIDSSTKNLIKSTLGLHIWGNTISWALVDKDGNLKNWNSQTFENSLKTNLVSLVNIIMKIGSQIPLADAYVMEADAYASLAKLKPAAYFMNLQRQQVIAIIISVLGMRRMSPNNETEIMNINNFYMMQTRSVSRLFNLNIGTEIVSADSVISDILSGRKIQHLPALPSITIDSDIINNYRKNDFSTRQLMHSALLVTLAFSNLLQK